MMLSALAQSCGIGVPGDQHGHCTICGRFVADGHPARFSDVFTSWQHLQAFTDAVLCPPCHEMLTNPLWRRANWLLSLSGVEWLQRSDIRNVVYSPPSPPYALYTTSTFKKHGWILLQQQVNTEPSFTRWAWDERLFVVQRERLLRMMDFAEELLSRGWKRTELVADWKHQHIALDPMRYRQWKQARVHPAWRWVVWCADLGQDGRGDEGGRRIQREQYSLF
jgi:hypothetical protein